MQRRARYLQHEQVPRAPAGVRATIVQWVMQVLTAIDHTASTQMIRALQPGWRHSVHGMQAPRDTVQPTCMHPQLQLQL